MRIAVFTYMFPAWTETFVSREVRALINLGHEVGVFTCIDPIGPKVELDYEVPVFQWNDEKVKHFMPDVMYGSLAVPAHKRMFESAVTFGRPFVFRIWSGLDAFAHPSADFYRRSTRHSLCRGVIVEDDFMAKHAVDSMGIPSGQIVVVPNSLDLDKFKPTPESEKNPFPRIFSIARFVKKKGLENLIHASNVAFTDHNLYLVGEGELESQLKKIAGPRTVFLKPIPEAQLPELYASATLYCLPCVQLQNRDADGIPTTILEAMACGLPVIGSDLLSASCYITHAVNGMLVPSSGGVVTILAEAIDTLLTKPEMRAYLGKNAAEFAREKLDIKKNVLKIERVLRDGALHETWVKGIASLDEWRKGITLERQQRYDAHARTMFDFLQVSGNVLDSGCGTGHKRKFLPKSVTGYVGIDVSIPKGPLDFEFHHSNGEQTPFKPSTFDTVLSLSVLQHVENPGKYLAECRRILKNGGRLAIEVCVNDKNPIFVWFWSSGEVTTLISEYFEIINSSQPSETILLINAQKR